MLRSDLCDYSDVYIVVKGRITVDGTDNANKRHKKLTFKNNAPFGSCISKINNKLIDNAEDLDIAVPVYSLLEYSDKYSVTSRSFWNYYSDKVFDDAIKNNEAGNYTINNNKKTASKSFEYKIKNIESTPANNHELDTEVIVPLKYLGNLWKSLDLIFIIGEKELDLSWLENFVISEISRTPEVPTNPAGNPPTDLVFPTQTTRAVFQITIIKLYIPVVTLSLGNKI